MWSRKELKTRGKQAFNRNYWKTVLVAVIISLLMGGGSFAYSFSNGFVDGLQSGVEEDTSDSYDNGVIDSDEFPTDIEPYGYGFEGEMRIDHEAAIIGLAIFGIVFIIIFLIVMAIAIVVDVFVLNPLEVGSRRFSIVNLNSEANVKEVAFGFDHNYKNVIGVMFYRDLYTFLWTLLFIIPGIVKSYEYRMIPYIMAEHPEMTKEQAFALSKQMMSGQKWKTFVLDLSFIGWEILSVCTLGILSIFYVEPYRFMTNAALYERLAYGNVNAGSQTGNDAQSVGV